MPSDQSEQSAWLRAQFPSADREPQSSPIPGGRAAALAKLAAVRPQRYGRERNFLDGAVTRLSPYLHHGILTLAEVAASALSQTSRENASRLLDELGWREYYRRVYFAIGDDVRTALEPQVTGLAPSAYAEALPEDIRTATTGLACMDGFVQELVTTGYLHNHVRMYFAAWFVHVRRISWKIGAEFFYRHLLDGDRASNSLSWQWVAGTFSHKPYFFNRENLEKYTRGTYCSQCPLQDAGCPFDADYPTLAERFFPNGQSALGEVAPAPALQKLAKSSAPDSPVAMAANAPTLPARVWLHDEALRHLTPAELGVEQIAADALEYIFVWDRKRIADHDYSLKRLTFMAQTITELGATVYLGDPLRVFAELQNAQARPLLAPESQDPDIRAQQSQLGAKIVAAPSFVEVNGPVDLRRFSRFWRKAQVLPGK